jgi:hypothetical protein
LATTTCSSTTGTLAVASTSAAAAVVGRRFPRLPAVSATPVPFLLSGRNMLRCEMFRCDAA